MRQAYDLHEADTGPTNWPHATVAERTPGGTMATVFTRILNGELPGRFVYRDGDCAAFLSINPLAVGHTLVVPVAEVDHWLDLDPDLLAHLTRVARRIGAAQQRAFNPQRVGLMIAGFEVPHVHLHVVPIGGLGDLNFANAEADPDPATLDAAASAIVAELDDGV